MNKDNGVTVAKSAGFCPGVKKAIDKVLALEASGKKPIYTLGPLIHNKQVTDTLEAKGITSIENLSEVKDKNAVLVIRAHGVTPQFQREIEDTKMEVCDATCPLVKHVHNIIKKYAEQDYNTVIVGDAGHAEVIGLLGYAKKGYVVANIEEAKKLPRFDKVNIVSQTTQKESVFLEIAEVIKQNSDEAIISNTICEPTRLRQSETIDMAKNADLVIVVGGKHSANTARLALLCSSLAKRTIHIESEAELAGEDLLSPKTIFITAGASTPNWVIDKVSVYVKNARRTVRSAVLNKFEEAWKWFVESSLYTAFGALALTYVSMRLQGVSLDYKLLALSWTFVLSLTLINRNRKDIFKSGLAALFALGFALALNLQIFLITALFLGVGIVYAFRDSLRFQKFTTLPGTKDIVTALGWGFVCAYVPAYSQGILFSKANLLAVFYAVMLVFARSVMLSVGAAQKDIMISKESFYKAFGPAKTRMAVFAIILVITGILIMLLAMGWKMRLTGMLLAGNIYIAAVASYIFIKKKAQNIWEETLIEGQFFMLCALSYLSKFL